MNAIRAGLLAMLCALAFAYALMDSIHIARADTASQQGEPVCGMGNDDIDDSPRCAPKPTPVRYRPWQEVWQCNDLRVTVTSNAPGMVNYDIAGSIWGGINFTFDGPHHQLYKGAWPCTLLR